MGRLEVIDGGLFTTIQDFGRRGFRAYGIPTSGAVDIRSYKLANWLVGNMEGSPVLELTLKGGRYKFKTGAVIAITGALMRPKINGKDVNMNCSLKVQEGDELGFDFVSRGCRTYLAIQGALEIQKVMGSFSTYTLGKFGGLDGKALTKGDTLKWKSLRKKADRKEARRDQLPYFSSKVCVRVSKNLEWDWLKDSAKKNLVQSTFRVGSKSNRMGIRLEGNSIEIEKKQMISSPVIPGIIQLPPNGQPIILMQDGQTIGGYPRVAKVVDEDLWRLGQIKTGDQIQFKLI